MSTTQKPYFEVCTHPFQDVPISDAGVDTPAFLDACEDLVKLFDVLGSTAFMPVQSDMKGNIKKIRDRFLATPDKSATLEELVVNEAGEKKRTATEGLLWLLRGLDFTAQALQRNQANKTEELSTSFKEAYSNTLKKHHGFLIRPIFAAAMSACPYRATFYPKLAATPEECDEKLSKWLAALDNIVKKEQAFYTAGKHDKGF